MARNKLLITSLSFLGAALLISEGSLAMIDSSGKLLNQQDNRLIESIIVKFNQNSSVKNKSMQEFSEYLSEKMQLDLSPVKTLSNGAIVFNIKYKDFPALSAQQSAQFNQLVENKLASLATAPEIKYANKNSLLYIQKTPNDSRYAEQWHYFDESAGINLPDAWDISTGNENIAVGIVDTGIVQHKELEGKILQGRNFIDSEDDPNEANDPTDHGGKTAYHGSHIAGTIAAVTNELGVTAGVAWGGKLVPARVLGTDGSGSMADIIEGMRWVAGLSNIKNDNPVKVLNLSLGGFGKCPEIMQETIDEINENGGIVVVAAGNNNMPAKYFTPANCKNVITVGASNKVGKKSYYSNYGNAIDIVAPGGDTRKGDEGGILSLAGPGEYQFLQGTSMASPHIAGVVALMASIKPDLSYKQAIRYLQKSVKNKTMKVGLVNANKALQLIQSSDNSSNDGDNDDN